jgi:hypothetical protein
MWHCASRSTAELLYTVYEYSYGQCQIRQSASLSLCVCALAAGLCLACAAVDAGRDRPHQPLAVRGGASPGRRKALTTTARFVGKRARSRASTSILGCATLPATATLLSLPR